MISGASDYIHTEPVPIKVPFFQVTEAKPFLLYENKIKKLDRSWGKAKIQSYFKIS